MFKAYSDNDDKYSGDPNHDFDQKYSLFLERCDQAEIDSEDDRRKAFSIMLTGEARKFYFQSLKAKALDLPSLVAETRGRFQTEERTRALLREWDDMTLTNVRRTQPNKNMSECLSYLTSRLLDIQCCLPEQYRNDVIMRDKLLNAIRHTPACRLTYQKPAPTLRGVIADLMHLLPQRSISIKLMARQQTMLIAVVMTNIGTTITTGEADLGAGLVMKKGASFVASPNVGRPITRFASE